MHEFEIEVSVTPPNIIGPIGPLALCALTVSDETKKNIVSSCNSNDHEVTCRCSGGDFFLSSNHRISRLTGKLTFLTVMKNDIRRGSYDCAKLSEKKVF
jgi:hypothetical protein